MALSLAERVERGFALRDLVVDDTDAMRERLEAAGTAFLWETQRDGAIAWAHFRGPDGAVYELIESER